MYSVTVTLHTGSHCIETESKNMFRNTTLKLLETVDESAADVLGKQLELLREFLETADFNMLRSSDIRLAGLAEGTCILSRDENGKPVLELID